MKILYLGLDFQNFKRRENALHYPVIKIVAKEVSFINLLLKDLFTFTHFIFTSPRAVDIFCTYLKAYNKFTLVQNKPLIAIGQSTNKALIKHNLFAVVAKSETQEGVIQLLEMMSLDNSNFLIPRSALARKELDYFFEENKIRYRAIDIYNTKNNNPQKAINLDDFDEVVFTSPSTVRAFIQLFKKIPPHLKLTAVGPITQKALSDLSVQKS